MIEVINKHKVNTSLITDRAIVDIMRGSPLGNKFRITQTRSREQTVKEYRIWLWLMIKRRDKAVITELSRIRVLAERDNVCLVCCCSPKLCHGEVIKSAINWSINMRAKKK